MAMNVSFKKGLKASLPSTRDANTFYYVSDEFALYLGEHLISNEVTAAQFDNLTNVVIPALEGRVKTLEDWKAALTELSKDNGANDLVKVTVTTEAGAVKSVAVDDAALDQKLADDLAAAKKYTDDAVEGIVSGSGYATQTWVTGEIQKLDAEVNSGDNDLVKVSVTEVDGVVTAVAVDDAKLDAKIAEYRTSAAQDLIDAAQDKALTDYKAEMVTAMSSADTAAQGYASAAESAAKGYADQKLLDFENAYIKADDNNTIDKLNEIAAWISDDEAGATKIISDVATNAANIKTINESAVMTSGITAAKVGEYDTIKNTVNAKESTWDNVANKLDASTYNAFVGTTYGTLDAAVAAANSYADSKDADIAKGVDAQGRVATLESKVDVDSVSGAIATATTDMATNGSVDGKLASYMTTEAHNTFVSGNAALQSGITAEKVNDMASKSEIANKVDTKQLVVDNKEEGSQQASVTVDHNGISLFRAVEGNTTKLIAESYNTETQEFNKTYSLVLPAKNGKIAVLSDVEALANGAVKQAQDEVDALELVVAQNAQTCQNNFNTIVDQLTWGSF